MNPPYIHALATYDRMLLAAQQTHRTQMLQIAGITFRVMAPQFHSKPMVNASQTFKANWLHRLAKAYAE